MRTILTALTVAAILFSSSASAFDPADLQKLKDTNACSACDLKNAYLSGADLAGANLMSADLSGAYLSGADLSGASLSGADLIFAHMNGANLSGALLKEADLFGANLEDAIMRGAILCKTLMPDYSMNDSGC
ncbi:pentapeptide repeat-containing protein [Sulfitobacter sp.]|nr:pentapeptide repeat-containing protein [Sulfitobacter sp.]